MELAEMPSCNLAESMHHKWNQQSGNGGSGLYIATVDDFIWALIQVVRYYQYLKGDRVGTGPGKEELQLRAAQRTAERTGDPKVLNLAMAKLPGAELFCTRAPHMAGEEVFGSQKQKADVPLGFESESHQPDKVNFSRPRIATRSSRANHATCSLPDVVEEVSLKLQEDQAPNNLGTMGDVERPGHVTAVHETACMETEWHIARLPKTSAKACFAQQAITKKKCEAKIVQGKKPTAAPTYTSVMQNSHKKRPEVMEFFFCNDDIERCVKGTKRKWGQSRPDIPTSPKRKSLISRVLASNYHSAQSSLRGDSSERRSFLSTSLHSPLQLLQMTVQRPGQVSPSVGTTTPLARSRPTTVRPLSP
jgi:hypothetical protein